VGIAPTNTSLEVRALTTRVTDAKWWTVPVTLRLLRIASAACHLLSLTARKWKAMPVLPRPRLLCRQLVQLLTQSPVVGWEGLAPPLVFRHWLKRPNGSLLPEPARNGAPAECRAPVSALATPRSTVELLRHESGGRDGSCTRIVNLETIQS
jgi:hypothetical protein